MWFFFSAYIYIRENHFRRHIQAALQSGSSEHYNASLFVYVAFFPYFWTRVAPFFFPQRTFCLGENDMLRLKSCVISGGISCKTQALTVLELKTEYYYKLWSWGVLKSIVLICRDEGILGELCFLKYKAQSSQKWCWDVIFVLKRAKSVWTKFIKTQVYKHTCAFG